MADCVCLRMLFFCALCLTSNIENKNLTWQIFVFILSWNLWMTYTWDIFIVVFWVNLLGWMKLLVFEPFLAFQIGGFLWLLHRKLLSVLLRRYFVFTRVFLGTYPWLDLRFNSSVVTGRALRMQMGMPIFSFSSLVLTTISCCSALCFTIISRSVFKRSYWLEILVKPICTETFCTTWERI